MTNLSNSPLVIIWRRVLDLPTTKRRVRSVHGWPLVGEDGYSAIYDAGSVLVGYWNQAEFLAQEPALSYENDAELPESCHSDPSITSSTRGTTFNPSNQLTLGVEDIGGVGQRLGRLLGKAIHPSKLEDEAGSAMSFVDEVGNTTRYLKLSNSAASGAMGTRLRALREAGLNGNGVHPAIGYELLVSDLEASRRFYGSALGLHANSIAEDAVVFDTGNLLLTLKREPSVGLVRTLRRARKLGDDLVVFYNEDLEKATSDLGRRGVVFPKGIEDSQHGRLAVFKDPDGHTLAAWQPPPRNQKPAIDYTFVLDRLLTSATVT
jgi:predicted enzyme related to lactoylglutathione lyase